MAERRNSLGVQCAAYGCFSREYHVVNGERQRTGLSFFSFPLKDVGRLKKWCSLIRRQNNRDGFVVGKHTRLCEKHFEAEFVYRPPGGTRIRLLQGALPSRHPWNDVTHKPKRKAPTFRSSPQKKCRIQPEQSEDESVSETEALPLCVNTAHDESIDKPNVNVMYEEIIKQLKAENSRLKTSVEEITRENCILKSEHQLVEQIKSSDETCNHYTGFKSYSRLLSVYKYLDFGDMGENLILYNNQERQSENDVKRRPRALTPMNSFLLTLMRLRRNFSILHLSFLFCISSTTASNIFISYINYMYINLGIINIWPTMEQVKRTMPSSMKEKYPNTKCIIDCLEIKVEVPSALFLHKLFYSDYKSHTTVKVLVGITPGGGFNFVSAAYPGSISDKNITYKCGILNPDLWESGEAIMADRGFTIKEHTDTLGIGLIIPSFLRGRDQMSETEVIETQQIANERIHVERMIQRLKCYHIFDRVIPISMIGTLNQIISVCAMLANFDDPIIKKNNVNLKT